MKCPICSKEGAKYKSPKKLMQNKGDGIKWRTYGRDNYDIECKYCKEKQEEE